MMRRENKVKVKFHMIETSTGIRLDTMKKFGNRYRNKIKVKIK
jgi:hypothetical protein